MLTHLLHFPFIKILNHVPKWARKECQRELWFQVTMILMMIPSYNWTKKSWRWLLQWMFQKNNQRMLLPKGIPHMKRLVPQKAILFEESYWNYECVNHTPVGIKLVLVKPLVRNKIWYHMLNKPTINMLNQMLKHMFQHLVNPKMDISLI